MNVINRSRHIVLRAAIASSAALAMVSALGAADGANAESSPPSTAPRFVALADDAYEIQRLMSAFNQAETLTPAGARRGNSEFEWKVEEGEP